MFKNYPNHQNANDLVSIFKPLFQCSKYNETYVDIFNGMCFTKYEADAQNNWKVNVNCYGYQTAHDKMGKKVFKPTIEFQKDMKSKMIHFHPEQKKERFDTSKKIGEFLQKLYNPDFERVVNIIDMFIEQGIESGMIKSANLKNYKKNLIDHMHINHYHGIIQVGVYNISTVTFNNVLQKSIGKKRIRFKKSFISIDIVYLVDSNNEVKPYFNIKLPYSSTYKCAYIIPLAGGNEISVVGDDNCLRSIPIDKINTLPLTKEALIPHFQNELKDEIKKAISKALKMKKTELDALSSSELKDYFVLVEMLKI